jgi:hypothetical protein
MSYSGDNYMRTGVTLRNRRAGAIIELAIILPLFVIMSLFCLDILILATASGVNERACRDAARMAGQATNYAASLLMAQTGVKAYRGDGFFITSPVVETAAFVYNDYSGNPPPSTSPYVSVTTSCQARLPAPIILYGLNYQNTYTTFRKTYTFPIVTTAVY